MSDRSTWTLWEGKAKASDQPRFDASVSQYDAYGRPKAISKEQPSPWRVQGTQVHTYIYIYIYINIQMHVYVIA